MKFDFKTGAGFERALDLIEDLINTCPECGAEEGINEHPQNQTLLQCTTCKESFSEKDLNLQQRIIIGLMKNGLPEQAGLIKGMDQDEFDDFLVNNIY